MNSRTVTQKQLEQLTAIGIDCEQMNPGEREFAVLMQAIYRRKGSADACRTLSQMMDVLDDGGDSGDLRVMALGAVAELPTLN